MIQYKQLVKTIVIILACVFLSILIQNVSMIWHVFKLYSFEYILHGITYILMSFIVVKWFITKILKSDLNTYRILPIKFFGICFFIGCVQLISVFFTYFIFVKGRFIFPHYNSWIEFSEMFLSASIITGIAAPLLEEMIFRGILLSYLEKKYNIYVAIFIPSILFATLHIFNGKLNLQSLLLLLLGGVLVGIMYSLATLIFESIWASVIIHIIWNLGGLFNFSQRNDNWGLVQYILSEKNVFITGGDYGVDTSIISIISYIFVILFLLVVTKTKSKNNKLFEKSN